MAKFSVIAKNEMLEQFNNIDDCQYAFEMYRYLTVEAGFPDVKIVDCETGAVLMYFKKDTTSYEYVDPDILASIAETPIEPNGIDEQPQELTYDMLFKKCIDKINAILQSNEISMDMKSMFKNNL